MKKTNLKNKMIFVMAIAMLASALSGCGSTKEKDSVGEPTVKYSDNAEKGVAAEAADDGGETAAAYETAAADETAPSDEAVYNSAEGVEFETFDAAVFDRSEAKMSAAEAGALSDGALTDLPSADVGISEEDMLTPMEPELDNGEPFVLTAGQWNDNDNWGFFTNLVNNGTIEFPAYGVDPRNRIEVTITGEDGALPNETVELMNGSGDVIWSAKTDKNGKAYLFYSDDTPTDVRYGDQTSPVTAASADDTEGQARGEATAAVEFTAEKYAEKYDKTEVMFILDTTGSMGDEIAYLQKDFSSIAEELADDNITFSANFYRDEGDDYVTKCNPFTTDVKEVQSQLNKEYAAGGGDIPEAVAEVLDETMTGDSWGTDTNKIAFLIFDAPPHNGREDVIIGAVKSAAEKGIHLVPVVASNSDRATELFGRALAITTNSNYVFLTDDSGVGDSHLEPIIGDYDVELLHDIIVRNIKELK
ncbi:vWA domain-containing protein [Ruminococcus sp.]|uniref:vWA domain-containing protein n=1 Tax=Ruminococcus sp. TaxID=41978 RepID=UPI0025FE6A86|nr:vWA domain-containing protein [Ruminococcus sp.]MBQ8967825.1 VWA domain-containing protein [Ruminococcus sp.]